MSDQDIKKILNDIEINKLLSNIDNATSIPKLEKIKADYLGKNSKIAIATKSLNTISCIEQKKELGRIINNIKNDLLAKFKIKRDKLSNNNEDQNDFIDVTLPPKHIQDGSINLINKTIEEISSIISSIGYTEAQGPEIEDDFHNFTALNFYPDHPARDTVDTMFIDEKDENNKNYLLRTHTSPTQIRTLKDKKVPLKIFTIGKTYRQDSDITHTPMFHQCEVLNINETVNMADLKNTVLFVLKEFFQKQDLQIRFRPSYFPFTSPSAEVDINFYNKNNNKNNWIEILGCGMVHPNVLTNCNIDNDLYQGFAIGFGIERMCMIKHNIKDIRAFYENDIEWLIYNNSFHYQV